MMINKEMLVLIEERDWNLIELKNLKIIRILSYSMKTKDIQRI